jgi:hypothetical protein
LQGKIEGGICLFCFLPLLVLTRSGVTNSKNRIQFSGNLKKYLGALSALGGS